MGDDWYSQNIEEPIRPVVRLLRDHGFNTISSCGHEMEVDIVMPLDGELKRMDDCLFNAGSRDYEIVFSIKRLGGHPYGLDIVVRLANPLAAGSGG